jgi:hypothetical protein
MAILTAVTGAILIAIILGDAFETIVLPRRVTRRVRLARLFFRSIWAPWSAAARSMAEGNRQEAFLSFFGPLSLIMLVIVWATGLIIGFALLLSASGTVVKTVGGAVNFSTYLYLSSTTFFTLGLGDVIPSTPLGRWLIAFESGTGLGFLALVISYLPLLNQAFSRREATISLLDARAGSPSTAAEMLLRHSYDHGLEALHEHLLEWERWAAELLESHLSYPLLAFFRSQHTNQSWLGALTTILDTCAFVIAEVEGASARQAELTFAMARHAIIDLSIIFGKSPQEQELDRLPEPDLMNLRAALRKAGLGLREGEEADRKLADLRRMYEPYIASLARFLCIRIPPWVAASGDADNWQTSAWELITDFRKADTSKQGKKKHF